MFPPLEFPDSTRLMVGGCSPSGIHPVVNRKLGLLCATSLCVSVVEALTLNHRDTERTEVAQRSASTIPDSRFDAEPAATGSAAPLLLSIYTITSSITPIQ